MKGFPKIFYFLIWIIPTQGFSQTNLSDSIKHVINKQSEDTNKVNSLIELSIQLNRESSYDSAVKFSESAISLSQKLSFKKGLERGLIRNGVSHYNLGNYPKALDAYLKALTICEELGDRLGAATCYNNMGNVYKKQNQLDLALENQFKALKIREEEKDKKTISASYTNIGVLYRLLEKYDEAQKYNFRALEIDKELNDIQGMAMDYGNISNIYRYQKKYKQALESMFNSLKLFEKMNDRNGTSKIKNNIGELYSVQGNFVSALTYFEESLKEARAMSSKDLIYTCYGNLATTYAKMNNMGMAYRFQKMQSDLNDSIMNEENSKQMAEMQVKFDTKQKVKEIEILTKDKLIDTERIKKQKVITYSVIGGLVLALLLAFFIFRSYRDKQRAHAEVSEKNKIIEEKNTSITDSINYAKRIQTSILPSHDLISKLLPEYFVLYKPKDIVSGDFYFFEEKGDHIFIAAADCTGHGVPGSLMSMIGMNLLHQVVSEQGLIGTAEILDELHLKVLLALNQDIKHRDSKDGMDVGLLRLDKKKRKISFSGAVRPLVLVDKTGLKVIKGDRYSIAGIKEIGSTPFATYESELSSDTCMYLFSDGYADQFGAVTGKKFMVKRLQDLLEANYSKPMEEQKKILNEALEKWKGSLEQVDDILVIGIRI